MQKCSFNYITTALLILIIRITHWKPFDRLKPVIGLLEVLCIHRF